MDYNYLLDAQISQPNATEYENVPEGMALAQIEDFSLRTAEWRDKDTGEQRSNPALRIEWNILDDKIRQALGREKLTVRQEFFLDIDRDSGQISTEKGKNVTLGKLRKALGLNDSGFALPQLRGSRPAMVQVSHRPDKNDPSKKYAEVKNVLPTSNPG